MTLIINEYNGSVLNFYRFIVSKVIKPSVTGTNRQVKNGSPSSKDESPLDAKLARAAEQVRKGYFFEADSKLISDILNESKRFCSGKS